MAFPAWLSELYETFRRKVGADKRPARVVPEPSWWHRSRAASRPKAVIEDTRFRRIDEKFDALSRAMEFSFFLLRRNPFHGLAAGKFIRGPCSVKSPNVLSLRHLRPRLHAGGVPGSWG